MLTDKLPTVALINSMWAHPHSRTMLINSMYGASGRKIHRNIFPEPRS